MQLSVQRPSSLQLSARTPAVECTGQVESVTVGRINEEKFTIFLFISHVLIYDWVEITSVLFIFCLNSYEFVV